MSKQDNNKLATIIHEWFSNNLNITEPKKIESIIHSFCAEYGYKPPLKLRGSGDIRRINAHRYSFVYNKWNHFIGFIRTNINIQNDSNSNENQITTNKQLIDSLITI